MDLKNYHVTVRVESDKELHIVATALATAFVDIAAQGTAMCRIEQIGEVYEMDDIGDEG